MGWFCSAEAAGQPADRPGLHQLSSAALPAAAALGGRRGLLREAGPAWKGTLSRTRTHAHAVMFL